MRASRRALTLLGAMLALALAPATANAVDPLAIDPAIDRAAAQLEAVQLPDGSFGARLSVRDSATAAEALRLTHPASPALTPLDAFLSPLDVDDVDSFARVALGSPAAADTSALLAQQNDDGGFGLSRDYQSDELDTALAVRALTALGERDAARRAATRLLKFANAGVWGADGDVALTSEALLAIDAYVRHYGSSSAIDAALTGALGWLSGAQQADGGWSPGDLSTRHTALAATALATSPAAVDRVGQAAGALLNTQQPDGSWGDPFSTALAIRALHAAGEAIERDRVTQLPDPSVLARDLSANPQSLESGKAITIKANVTNAGAATASGASAEFFLDDPAAGGDPVRTVELPDIEPGAQAPVETTVTLNRAPGRVRAYVVVRAPAGQDRNLANNSSFINIFVRATRNSYERVRDWPRGNRDIQRSGTTPNNLHPGIDPDPIWRVPATGAQIAAEGKVFYGSGNVLVGVDAKTGAQAWQAPNAVYADDRYRAPVYSRGKVYRSGLGSAGWLRARDGAYRFFGTAGTNEGYMTNEVLPQEEGYDPVFTYFARASNINTGGTGGGKCRMGPQPDISYASGWTGATMWKGKSPLFPPPTNPGEGNMFLNHPCDGQPLWFASDDDRAFVSNLNHLSAFNPRTGEGPNGEPVSTLFSVQVPGMARIPGPPLVDSLGQAVVAGWDGSPPASATPIVPGPQTGKGRVVAANPANGSPYWSFTTDTRLDGSPVEYKGTIIVVDRSGKVYGLDQVTGALEWSWKPADYVPPAVDQQGKSGQTLALSRHYLYVPHPDGHVYTLDARDGTVLSTTLFEARPYDLAIDDTNNAVYVRTLDGKLGAYPTRETPDQCAPDPENATPAPGDVDRVSFKADGSQLGGLGARQERPAISGNGRYVAFARENPDFSTQLHVRDLETGQTQDIPELDQVNSDTFRFGSHAPVLSHDGRYLAYITRQRNNRTGEDARIMVVRDLQTNVTDPVLKKPDGTALYNVFVNHADARDGFLDGEPVAMADDGRTVAFATGANNFVAGDTDGQSDVFVVDRVTQQRKMISLTTSGQNMPHQAVLPTISRDGRYVAFSSDASLTGRPIEPGNNNDQTRIIHRYDLATNQLEAVSVTRNGTVTGGYGPHISGNGRFVSFSSQSHVLVPPAWLAFPFQGGARQGYVWDSTTGQVEMASLNNSGEPRETTSVSRPVVSDDGRYVAWHTNSSEGFYLKDQTVDEQPQVFARDRVVGTAEQVSHTKWGTSGLGSSQLPVLSADGSRVAFISTAADLAEGDTNNLRDVFVFDRSSSVGDEPPATGGDGGGGSCPGAPEDAEDYSDLSVDAGDIQPTALEQGQPGQVEVTVRNGGAIPSEATTVRLYDGAPGQGTLIGEQPLAELAAGASTKLSFTWDPVGAAGQRTLTAVVDPERLVFEQDVTDNEAQAAAEVVAPRLDLSVDADKDAYGADEAVELATRIANSSLAGRDLRLVVSVRDEDDEEIANLHDGQVHVDANGELTVDSDWNTRDTTPARYTVVARLMNAVGDELAGAEPSFEIEPDVDAGLALETDELSYGAADTARIAALVTNRSANSSLAGASVELTLDDPNGDEVETWDLSAGEVGLGRSTRLTQEQPLADLDPGTYDLSARLIAADGTELAEAATDFELRSSSDSGDGVRGSLTASPADPYRFSRASFAYSLTNAGNADIEGATVRVRISDLTSGDTVKTLDEARTITRDGANTGTLSTTADMAENRDYQASLHLLLADGSERPLDRAIIRVRPVPFIFGASFDTAPRNRVLVWACQPADDAAARAALGDTYATFVTGCGDGHEEQRRFMRLLRSGDYNQFWIVGKHHPIERGMGDELGARVIQGDGLLVASSKAGHDLNAGGNLSPFGAAFAGTVPPGSYTLQFAGGSAFAGLDAQVVGAPAKLTTTQATGIATTAWGSANSRKTAISATYNQFGRGKAVFVGSPPSDFADRSKASAVLDQAARVLLPAAGATRAAGMARIELFVEGVAPGSPLELRTQLPSGTGVPQPPAGATFADGVLALPFETAGTQRKVRDAWLKLPTGTASLTTGSSVFYRDDADGQMKQYGDPATATLDIAEDKQKAADAAQAALGQVGGANGSQLQKIKDDVTAAAQNTTDTGVLWSRLRALVDDIGTLEKSRWTNAGPAWAAVARLVTYVEHDYYAAGGN